MSMDELKGSPEWRELLTGIQKTLDKVAEQVLSAAEREGIDRVRYLAGYHAGIKATHDFLRRP